KSSTGCRRQLVPCRGPSDLVPCRAKRDRGTARHARTHSSDSKRVRESEVPLHTTRPEARNSSRLLPRLQYEERVATRRRPGIVGYHRRCGRRERGRAIPSQYGEEETPC